jgi:type IV pilus assembly protein PilM
MPLQRVLSLLGARSGATTVGAIGFELGAEGLHMVQLERRAHEVTIRAMGSTPLEPSGGSGPPESLGPLVRKALASQPFRGRRIVTAMPDSGVKLMVVSYEGDSGRSEPQRILSLVEERIDTAIADCVVDYRPIRMSDEERGAQSALVAVARRDAVIEYLEALRGAGLRVEALEIAPVSIHRLVAWLGREEPSRSELVLHCGRTRSHLIALSGRRLILYREIDFGEEAAVEALAKALDTSAESAASMLHRYGVWPDEEGRRAWNDPAEALEVAETLREILKPAVYALVEEVERAGAYTASRWRGANLECVWLLGRFERWPGVERLLESLVSIPTSAADPLAALRNGRSGRSDSEPGGEIAVALGLALRGMTGDE